MVRYFHNNKTILLIVVMLLIFFQYDILLLKTDAMPSLERQSSQVKPDSTAIQLSVKAMEIELTKKEINIKLEAFNSKLETIQKSFEFIRFVFVGIAALGTILGIIFMLDIRQREKRYESRINVVQDLQGTNLAQINEVIVTIKNIMNWKLKESELTVKSQELIGDMEVEIKRLKEDRDKLIKDLLRENELLKTFSRFAFEEPDENLKEISSRFKIKMDSIPDFLLDNFHKPDELNKENKDISVLNDYGSLFLQRGIIGYHDDDVFMTNQMLEIALKFYTILKDHPEYKVPASFTHYYLALFHRDYGSIKKAQTHIDESFKIKGENEANELLTPIVRAEIHFYNDDDVNDIQEIINDILSRIQQRRDLNVLAEREANYESRIHLLGGDVNFKLDNLKEALGNYNKAKEINQQNCEAYFGLGQVYGKQNNSILAKENFDIAFDLLNQSNDLNIKTDIKNLIKLNSLAYFCKKGQEEAKLYRGKVKDALERLKRKDTDEFKFKPYSLIQKKPIEANKYIDELIEQ